MLACVPLLLLGATPPSPVPTLPCPPEVEQLVDRGWTAYRADSIEVAGQRFRAARARCPDNLDAAIGLGYVSLRQGQVASADSLFHLVASTDSLNGDAWDGLTLTTWRRGDPAAALAAGRRAIRLHPDNATTLGILNQLDPDWNRRSDVATWRRGDVVRVDARTRGNFFEVPGPSGWRRFYVNGVNLGVALPGKFPSEFPTDSALYAGWLDTLAAMHANTLRLYTILPPTFYRALRGWNLSHPRQPLWLIHGVWTELPPQHDFEDAEWKESFRAEMRRVVDLLHGDATIPPRPGHAGGRYDADVSRWTLGYIIGREWEPYAAKEFDARHPKPPPFRGRYLVTLPGATALDGWMAEQCDYQVRYEVERYNTTRPIAYTNWPTLDPLHHPTEATAAEESAWRRKVGRELPRDPIEYENDAVGLDAMLVRATPGNPAGWFASYHAYPYYPDFMLYDAGYDSASSSLGRSNYFGYLKALKRHHAGVPLLLSEYGVPSSRGVAHLQPQGWNHGGHDELAMARIDARLTREIRESGAAGGIIFAWIDEWFKKNWIVIDYEIPLENTRQWHNVMDAEQNYGILGMYAGEADRTPELGGDTTRWLALPALRQSTAAVLALAPRLHVGSDASYLYLALEVGRHRGQPFPWDAEDVVLALDTYQGSLGQRLLPAELRSEIGFEFLATFRDSTDADLRITPDYNPYQGADVIQDGDDFGKFARRPIRTDAREDGRWDSLFVITNRARFTRSGRFIPARGYNRGRLRYGTAAQSTLSDWYWDQAAGVLELRLPWGLINVSDPSTRTVLFDTSADGDIGTSRIEGFHLGAAVIGKVDYQDRVIEAAPPLDHGAWRASDFSLWQWSGWSTPTWHQRLKPVYDSLKAVFGGQR